MGLLWHLLAEALVIGGAGQGGPSALREACVLQHGALWDSLRSGAWPCLGPRTRRPLPQLVHCSLNYAVVRVPQQPGTPITRARPVPFARPPQPARCPLN